MKILFAHKFFYPHGGTEQYLFELMKILKSHSHKVIPFSMKHPLNIKSPYERFFVSSIDYRNRRLSSYFRAVPKMIFSLEAAMKIKKLIKAEKPDIAHIEAIDHQISPSILYVLKRFNIPVVQSLNNYKMVCPSGTLFNLKKGKVCEKCLGGRYYHCVLEKCHLDSFFASLLVTLEMYIHHKILKVYEEKVDVFLVGNELRRKKLINAGFKLEKILMVRHPIYIDDYKPNFSFENYFLFVGRFTSEKGVFCLLNAMKKVKRTPLYIIGEGKMEFQLKEFKRAEKLENVKFLGPKWGNELKEILAKAMFVVLPSEKIEGTPMVIFQSFCMGKPIIGSKIGGIPEIVKEKENGFLFEPGDHRELSEKIMYLVNNPKKCIELGKNARKFVEENLNPEKHYRKLMEIYQLAIKKHRR